MCDGFEAMNSCCPSFHQVASSKSAPTTSPWPWITTGHITILAFLPQTGSVKKNDRNHGQTTPTGLVMATFSMQILEAIDLNANSCRFFVECCRLPEKHHTKRRALRSPNLLCQKMTFQMIKTTCSDSYIKVEGLPLKRSICITCYQSEAVGPKNFSEKKEKLSVPSNTLPFFKFIPK